MADFLYSDPNMYYGIYGVREQVFDEYSINQSISTILGTVPGQRVFRPEFGSNLFYQLFEPMNDITASSIRNMIIIAIEQWETRIVLEYSSVVPNYDEQVYVVDLIYRIPSLENKQSSFAFSLSKLPG